jgi:chromosome segregation ATPase
MTTDEQFNPGQGCKAPASGGWCVADGDCLYACQFGGQSTSAHLRQTQADLSRAERERDEALAKRDQMTENGEWWMRECRLAQAELSSARQELARVERERGAMSRTNVRLHGEVLTVQSERDYLRAQLNRQQAVLSAELTLALAELDAARQSARDARSWEVARQDIGREAARERGEHA